MYEAFLSFNQMKPYWSMLQISGLLEYDQSRMIYTTTKRGTEFLALNEKMNELSGLANIFGIQDDGSKRSFSLPKRKATRTNQTPAKQN